MASSSNFRSVFLPSKSRLLAFVSVPSAFRRLFPRFSEPLFPIMYGLSKQRRRSDKSKIRHEFGDAREQCALVFFGRCRKASQAGAISRGCQDSQGGGLVLVKPNQKCQASFSVVLDNACQDCISQRPAGKRREEGVAWLVQQKLHWTKQA